MEMIVIAAKTVLQRKNLSRSSAAVFYDIEGGGEEYEP